MTGRFLDALAATRFRRLLRDEFRGYNLARFQRDLLAGTTVAAVALPLALAFGVASGATAAAGLVTAVIAGFLIGGLSGAPYQVSGPTGAMSAVLLVVAGRHGLEGVWLAGLLAGIMILLLGVFNLGRIVNFIPTAVIAGFTSGIALIIVIGQIDNLLGISTPQADSALQKLLQYARLDFTPDWAAVGLSLAVIAIMVLWPARWNTRFPGSLLAIVVAGVVTAVFNLDVPTIGAIPRTIVLDDRLTLSRIPWSSLGSLVMPALSIAALGTIESLLCGAVAGRMSRVKMDTSQELISQGLGNIVIPFFGGVPATAAIARTSVALRSGGVTRVTSLVHSAILLCAALYLAPMIARIPLAALGGVLAVTAWRMNDWPMIRKIFARRFAGPILKFSATMVATVALDLTQAIIIGVGVAALTFVMESSQAGITIAPVSEEKMRMAGYEMANGVDNLYVVYVVGPLFFGTVNAFNEAVDSLLEAGPVDVVLSLRTVPLLDTTGIEALERVMDEVERAGGRVYLSGLTDPVREDLKRAGVLDQIGEDQVFWSAFEAIVAADRRRAELAPIA